MTVYKHLGIIWGILVSSFMWANSLKENDCTGAVVKQERQPSYCFWIPSVTIELCGYDVTHCSFCDGNTTQHHCMPRRLLLFSTLSMRSWKGSQPLCVPSMSKYKSVPSLLGLGDLFFSFHGHLHLQYGSSPEETRSCKFTESFFSNPHRASGAPSSVACLFGASLLWNSGLSHNDYLDGRLGLTTVVTNQKGREPQKRCPTLNS